MNGDVPPRIGLNRVVNLREGAVFKLGLMLLQERRQRLKGRGQRHTLARVDEVGKLVVELGPLEPRIEPVRDRKL